MPRSAFSANTRACNARASVAPTSSLMLTPFGSADSDNGRAQLAQHSGAIW
ncbi:hypothetical protein KCP70_08000 [Salmonella enterica subsp. enterica]|nr:hypothetical protein KCP70_08000 [Salmonella enterica subsp. enterica]